MNFYKRTKNYILEIITILHAYCKLYKQNNNPNLIPFGKSSDYYFVGAGEGT